MKLLDATGRDFNPQMIAAVLTGKLLWVDAVNGMDSIAVRERMTVPFKTLSEAKNAALSGDTIVVLPGTYNEKNLLKDGVNWHFLNGAIVAYTGTSAGAIFDTSSNGTNGAVTSFITGYGKFTNSNTSGTGNHVVHCAVGASAVVIEARLIQATQAAIKANVSSGSLDVGVRQSIISTADHAVWNAGSSTDNIIRAHSIHSSGGSAVAIESGSADVFAHSLVSAATGTEIGAVTISGGSGHTKIRAFEIYASTIPALRFSASSSAKITILGARLKSDGTSDAGRAVTITSSANDSVRLPDCVLIAAGDYSIAAANANTRVHALTGLVANKSASNISWVPSGFTLQTDSNIS